MEYTSTPSRPACLRVSQTGVRLATHQSIRLHPSFHDTDPRPQDHRYVRKGDHRHRLLITTEDARAKNAGRLLGRRRHTGDEDGRDPPSYPPPTVSSVFGRITSDRSSVSRPLIRAARRGPVVFLDHRRHWTRWGGGDQIALQPACHKHAGRDTHDLLSPTMPRRSRYYSGCAGTLCM